MRFQTSLLFLVPLILGAAVTARAGAPLDRVQMRLLSYRAREMGPRVAEAFQVMASSGMLERVVQVARAASGEDARSSVVSGEDARSALVQDALERYYFSRDMGTGTVFEWAMYEIQPDGPLCTRTWDREAKRDVFGPVREWVFVSVREDGENEDWAAVEATSGEEIEWFQWDGDPPNQWFVTGFASPQDCGQGTAQ